MAKEKHLWVFGVQDLHEHFTQVKVHRCASIEDVKGAVMAFVITAPADEDWMTPLAMIRTHSEFLYTPVFYQGTIPDELHTLFDGPVDKNLPHKAAVIHDRIAMISLENRQSDSADIKTLAYIFSREHYDLMGYLSAKVPSVYDYPLLRILLHVDERFDAWKFLNDMVMRDLLEYEDQPDKIHVCPGCDSGLFNVLKCCPNCSSVDIKRQKLVHCYFCGKIGTVPEFLREERMICSRCKVKLVEQGVDYECPKEDKLCLHCDSYFHEPKLQLVCLVCKHQSNLADLDIRHMRSFTLSRRSKLLLRGIERNYYKHFNQYFKVIDYVEFCRIVNWQVKLAKRYDSVYFSVMNIRFNLVESVRNAKELALTEKLMGDLFANLRTVLRESDLSTRIDEDFFFLLPMTDEEGGRLTIGRIQQLISKNPISNSPTEINLQLSFTASHEMIAGEEESSCAILAKLQDKTEMQQQFYLKQ